jgi:hypothetical protein
MMRVTTEEVPLVVVVDGRGYEWPTCFNLPPAVIPSTAQRFPRANDNPGELTGARRYAHHDWPQSSTAL